MALAEDLALGCAGVAEAHIAGTSFEAADDEPEGRAVPVAQANGISLLLNWASVSESFFVVEVTPEFAHAAGISPSATFVNLAASLAFALLLG